VDELDCLQVLLQYGARRDAVDKDGRTALHYVAYKCSDDEATKTVERIIRELITTAKRRPDALSAFVNRTDMKGKTALHRAAYHGQLQAVQTLLGCHADVRAKDRLGCTPLLAAANAKDVDEVTYMIYIRYSVVKLVQQHIIIIIIIIRHAPSVRSSACCQ